MTSRALHIIVLFFILNCNKNPVDIDYDNLPDKPQSYTRYGITSLIEFDSCTYYGFEHGYSKLHIITPGIEQDSTGSIRRFSKSNHNFSNPRFFRNENDSIYIVDKNGIYYPVTPDSIINLFSFSNSYYWDNNFTLTPKNECVFVNANIDSFSVHKWKNTEDSLIFTLESPCQSYNAYDFAFADSLFAFIYSNDSIPDKYYLSVYKNGSLIENEPLFTPTDYNEIKELFFLDGYIGILLYSVYHQTFNLQDTDTLFYSKIKLYPNYPYVIYKKPSFKWVANQCLGGHLIYGPPDLQIDMNYYKSDYRNENEIWLHSKKEYWRIKSEYLSIYYGSTTDEYEYCFRFRESFYLTYSFKSDSTIIFYDEYSQDFVTINY